MDLLGQKIKMKDNETKDIEKKFQKEKAIDAKEFINSFMAVRKDYHKFQIYKMKV